MSGIGVFYGRMNPFTRGHEAAINEIKKLGLKPVVIVTHSQNSQKNPLTVNEKINVIRNSLKNNSIRILATSSAEPKLHTILNELRNRGNTNIRVFLGSNRIKGIGEYVKKKRVHPGPVWGSSKQRREQFSRCVWHARQNSRSRW